VRTDTAHRDSMETDALIGGDSDKVGAEPDTTPRSIQPTIAVIADNDETSSDGASGATRRRHDIETPPDSPPRPQRKSRKRTVRGTLDDPAEMRKYFRAIFWFSVVLLIVVGVAVIAVLASSEVSAISRLQKILIGVAFFVFYSLLVTAVIVSRHWHLFNNLLTHVGCFFSGATLAALIFLVGLTIYATVH